MYEILNDDNPFQLRSCSYQFDWLWSTFKVTADVRKIKMTAVLSGKSVIHLGYFVYLLLYVDNAMNDNFGMFNKVTN